MIIERDYCDVFHVGKDYDESENDIAKYNLEWSFNELFWFENLKEYF